jgi:hypothetical protein
VSIVLLMIGYAIRDRRLVVTFPWFCRSKAAVASWGCAEGLDRTVLSLPLRVAVTPPVVARPPEAFLRKLDAGEILVGKLTRFPLPVPGFFHASAGKSRPE